MVHLAMGYMFTIQVILVFCSGAISQQLPIYNFEDVSVPSEISPQSSLRLNTSLFKNGSKSLEWQWSSGQTLSWNLSSNAVDVAKNAGIQIWIYNSLQLAQKCLSICVRQIRGTVSKDSCFPFALNFVGWRAAWVSYIEFFGCGLPSSTESVRGTQSYQGTINRFFLIAPSGVTSSNPLHIDVLQFVSRISKAIRDSFVPPLTYSESGQRHCTNCTKVYSGLSEEDALSHYGRKSYWKQMFRWSLRSPLPFATSEVNITKLEAINNVTRRLVNWYANENTTFTRIPHRVSPTDSILTHRWDSLVKNFDNAREQFSSLVKSGSDTPTAGLFSRASKLGGKSAVSGSPKKFSFVFFKVLLPLTLEYFVKSRPIEIKHVACELAKKYHCNSTSSPTESDIEAITGKDSSLKNYFRSFYGRTLISNTEEMHPTCSGVKQNCFEHVKNASQELNNIRKTKIIGLFNYIEDQGFSEGSAYGSTDHELLSMSGFAHAMFLMREELKSEGKLDGIIDSMKWYTEFGEVYQETFEFKGSTADRIRSAMLFRLLTVLVMPENNDVQKREKIRDMDALKNWIENALSLTGGLSDLLKPDYTCFHHRTYYASAYCPSALHIAALISYLFEGTVYQLNSEIKENINYAMKVYRIVAVRYSTPSAVGGRFIKYDQAVLAQHIPAFAYLAVKYPLKLYNSNSSSNLNVDYAQVPTFLRLYEHVPDTCEGILNSNLCDGKVSRIFYLNTLGSLEIMARVKIVASNAPSGPLQSLYTSEASPSGHWSKQFAALNIHRRDDWAVTVKGFDKYVWDFESSESPGANLYGMYSSHGAMLIANSESALSSKNIAEGWDWRKVPGTTAIQAPYSDMLSVTQGSTRHYNPRPDAMAGGVFLQGSKSKNERNGVFGMNFEQPTYDVEATSPFASVDFRFKKSVFFYDDIIVSLGSNIGNSGGQHEVHTTLFQDLMPSTSSSTTNQSASSNVFRCNDGGSLTKTSWSSMGLAIVVDVHGNRYYVRKPDQQGLVFSRNQRQDSVKGNEVTPEATNGMYCTAWFNHGVNPPSSKRKYEYAVQIEGETVGRPQKSQFVPQDRYRILKRGRKVHALQFYAHNNRGNVYGYVIFPIAPPAPINMGKKGPLTDVFNQSVIMVEEKSSRLYISVNSPQLMLHEKEGSPPWCQNGTITPSETSDVDETLLFCSESIAHAIHVSLRNNADWSELVSLYVDGKNKTSTASNFLVPQGSPLQNPLKFINMRNGAETEVTFK